MRITNDGNNLYVQGMTQSEYDALKATNIFRYDRRAKALVAPMSVETVDEMMKVVPLPKELMEERRRMEALRFEIDIQRTAKKVVPLFYYPVRARLYDHQIRGANMAMLQFGEDTKKHGFGFLFEMGCGKTLTAMAVMGAMYMSGKIRRVLIVAPSSVVSVWERELAQFAEFKYVCRPMLGAKQNRIDALNSLEQSKIGNALAVAVINYESVWRDGIFEALTRFGADMVIADESQRIKTHDAAQSKAMHKLGDQARYKLILSGTPVQNGAIDIWSQYRFLDQSVFGASFYAFRSKYAVMGGFNKKQIVAYNNVDELIRREHSVAYRVTKADALDLPEQTFENRIIHLPDGVMKMYGDLKRESAIELENGGNVTAATILTKLMRLQQLTGGFVKADEGGVTQVHTAKLDALREIVNDCRDAGQKVVVFARFTAEVNAICDMLGQIGIGFRMIDGSVPTEHKTDSLGREIQSRAERVQDFQTDPDITVFVAQIQTAGLGITLHAASVAVYYSMDFNYANYEQATARIHRIGQRHPCTYIHLVADGTIDEKVLAAVSAKKDLAADIVDRWKEFFT